MANKTRYFEPSVADAAHGFEFNAVTLRENGEAVLYFRKDGKNETLLVRGPSPQMKDEKGNVTRAACAGGQPFYDDETGAKAAAAIVAFLEKGVTP